MFDSLTTEMAAGARVGRLARRDADGRVHVVVPSDPGTTVPARLALPERDAAGLREGVPVLLVFDDGDPTRPIVVGIVRDALPPEPVRVQVDRQEEIRLEADRTIVLRCGKSSITLRRDGKIEIRGAHLLSRATGPHRIKGGTVQIN